MSVSSIPAGYHSVTPYLIIKGAARALEWYQKAFGAKEKMRLAGPDGSIGHAEMVIGDSHVMMADEHSQMQAFGPEHYQGSPVSLLLYVDDVDETFQQAVDAGAEALRPVQDQFYGDRMGTLKDPFGHTWSIGTHIEDVSQEEVERRMAAMGAGLEEKSNGA